MHELSVAQNILDIALKHAGGSQVTDIYLVIGQLSSIGDECIRFYWDLLARSTAAEGAHLHFRHEPAILRCHDCEHQFTLNGDFACLECGSFHVQVVSGDQFYLEAIEVESVPV